MGVVICMRCLSGSGNDDGRRDSSVPTLVAACKICLSSGNDDADEAVVRVRYLISCKLYSAMTTVLMPKKQE